MHTYHLERIGRRNGRINSTKTTSFHIRTRSRLFRIFVDNKKWFQDQQQKWPHHRHVARIEYPTGMRLGRHSTAICKTSQIDRAAAPSIISVRIVKNDTHNLSSATTATTATTAKRNRRRKKNQQRNRHPTHLTLQARPVPLVYRLQFPEPQCIRHALGQHQHRLRPRRT